MALIKSINIGGQPFEYWTIETIQIDQKAKNATINVNLYKNKTYYQSNPEDPIRRKMFSFSDQVEGSSDFPFIEVELNKEDSNQMVVAYAALAELSFFSGATVDLDPGQDPADIDFPDEMEFI